MDSQSTYHKLGATPAGATAELPTTCRPSPHGETESVRETMQSDIDKGAAAAAANDDDDVETPITLGLAIRRTRLAAFAAAMIVSIVGLTVWFHHGMELDHFDSRDKNVTEQNQLLDDYNSYSGNVASIFAKPVELFVTVAVQVIVLRFMADTFTRPEMSWKISAVTLLLGAGIGYMIGNGFNALNVQLRPQPVYSVITSADLRLEANFQKTELATRSTSQNESIPEASVRNPVTNTLLKTVVLPKSPREGTYCKWIESEYTSDVNKFNGAVVEVHESVLDIGFPEHDWQGRILKESLPSDSLRVVVDATDASVNSNVNSSTLPMKSSLAADLFYYAMMLGPSYFPWGSRHDFANRSEIAQRYPVENDSSNPLVLVDSTAKFYGLLPSNATLAVNETASKEWFVRESMAAVSRQFAFSERTKTSDISMEFSHTQIAPGIAFDAVTFEVEIDPLLLATAVSNDSTTWHTVLNQIYDCPWPAHCMVRKPSYKAVEPAYDPAAQVVAFTLCTDETGAESLHTNFTRVNETVVDDVILCSNNGVPAANAMLVVSIGKRLVADSLEQNVSRSAEGDVLTTDLDAATVTNLRKVYSFTVGHLTWELTDLASQFHADCRVEGGCMGLELELSTPVSGATAPETHHPHAPQRLVLGKDSLPLNLLSTPQFLVLAKTTLVSLNEPPQSPTASPLYEVMAGDVLLPHNVRNVTWDKQSLHTECDAQVEDRIAQQLKNHYYMEHTLQSAYTAATFFLFQHGVVHDAITVGSDALKSLAFEENAQQVSVWVSTPAQNMWLTLAGCFTLVAGLGAVLLKVMWAARRQNDVLSRITEPQAIARVLMDERQYPPLFLHRRVVEKHGASAESVDRFSIAALSLQQQQQLQQQTQRAFRGGATPTDSQV